MLYKYYVSRQYLLSCFYLKHNFSETEFCLRVQVKRTRLGPIDRVIRYYWTPALTQDVVYKPSTEQIICES
jgi:hypothetical protein